MYIYVDMYVYVSMLGVEGSWQDFCDMYSYGATGRGAAAVFSLGKMSKKKRGLLMEIFHKGSDPPSLIFGSYGTGDTHLTTFDGVCTKCVSLLWIGSEIGGNWP